MGGVCPRHPYQYRKRGEKSGLRPPLTGVCEKEKRDQQQHREEEREVGLSEGWVVLSRGRKERS